MIDLVWAMPPAIRHAPFLVCGTPRSRTTWLARFLSYEGTVCEHEPSLRFHSRGDIATYFSRPNIGASDSPMTFLACDAKARIPNLKVVVVERPLDEVKQSGRERGLVFQDWFLARLSQEIAIVKAELDPLVVTFRDLEDRATCAAIFEYCLDQPFVFHWWHSLRHENIQSNIRQALRTIRGNHALRCLLAPAYAG